MPEHTHHGEAHGFGTRPPACVAAGFRSPVVRCDRGGWFDPQRPLFCVHAEPAAADESWTPPPGGVPWHGAGGGGGGGGPHVYDFPPVGGGSGDAAPPRPTGYEHGSGYQGYAWTRPVRLPGSADATVVFARAPRYGLDRPPLRTVEIPCNPDAPGEAKVELREKRAPLVDGDAPAGLGDAVASELGFALDDEVELTLDQVLRGERCRSVRFEIHVQAVQFLVTVMPVTGKTSSLSVWKPVGLVPVKTYVEPTCCTQTTQRLQRTVETWLAGADGERPRAALRRAADELLAARSLLPHPTRTAEAIEAYAYAARHLLEVGGGGPRGAADAIAGIVRGLAEPAVADALASPFAASDSQVHTTLVAAGASAAADLATADAARAERPDQAIVRYAAAYRTAAAGLAGARAAGRDLPPRTRAARARPQRGARRGSPRA